MTIDNLTQEIIAAAIEVHRELGPGLLESAYETCLEHELKARKLGVERQKSLPVIYKGENIECGYRIDLLINQKIIIEIKAVQMLGAVHEAQLLSYLKLAGIPVGLLINFNVKLLKHGLRRMVNEFPDSSQ